MKTSLQKNSHMNRERPRDRRTALEPKLTFKTPQFKRNPILPFGIIIFEKENRRDGFSRSSRERISVSTCDADITTGLTHALLWKACDTLRSKMKQQT